MTRSRNLLGALLAGGVMLIRSASPPWGFSGARAAGRGLSTLAAAAGLLLTLAIAPASARPPDGCQRNLNDGDEGFPEVKGSEIKNLTVCWWDKGGVHDFTYTGTIKDTASDGARARLIARLDFIDAAGKPQSKKTVLMEAAGKGEERDFGRAAGGGAIHGVANFHLRLQTYDKSKGKVKDSSRITF